MTPQSIILYFFSNGQMMAAQIQPYAIHLLGILTLVEVITIALTWMMGSDDPPEILWRIVRLLFTSGFGYWWITSAFALGTAVIGSFDSVGRQIANAPGGLAPSSFFDLAIRITKLLWNAPSSNRLLPSIGLDILEGLLIIAIMIMLGLLGAAAIFALASAFLIVGPGSIFVGFMPCRFTSAMSENYFVWLVRMGGLVLGFYVVLAALQHFGMQWYTALNGACGPVAATLPSPVLGGAPVASAAISCTKAIGVNDLLTLFFCILILTLVGLALPLVLASMAGHGVDMTLENLASAKYLTSGAARQLSNGMHFLGHQISRMMHQSQQQTTLNQRMEAGASAAARTASSTSGFSGGPPPSGGGWNGRPSGPPIAPPPAGPNNSGPGGSPAGLTYQPQPGRPGHQTRAEAMDITNLQGANNHRG